MANPINTVAGLIDADRPKYAEMAHQVVADSMNAVDQTRVIKSISRDDLYELIDEDEFAALTADKKEALRDLYLLDTISLETGSRARKTLMDAFPDGTDTRTAVVAALTELVSLAGKNGIGEVGIGWVINARRQLGII